MTLGVGWMLRSTFRVGSRQKVRPILGEYILDGGRIHHVAMNRVPCSSGHGVVNQTAVGDGSQRAMHEPLLVPHRLERALRHFPQEVLDVSGTESDQA